MEDGDRIVIDAEAGIWHLANAGAVTWAQWAHAVADLEGRNADLIDAARLNALVSFAALAPDGRIVEARDADLPLPPASTLKTVTALYALDRLGHAHRFRTRVLLEAFTQAAEERYRDNPHTRPHDAAGSKP